jgi:hypothetical protein
MEIEQILTEYRSRVDSYAEYKSKRVYLEDFKKSLVATLMKQAEMQGHKTAAAQEREAYANQEYSKFLDGLSVAVKEEERLRYQLKSYEMEMEVWRTLRADERMERKAYGA